MGMSLIEIQSIICSFRRIKPISFEYIEEKTDRTVVKYLTTLTPNLPMSIYSCPKKKKKKKTISKERKGIYISSIFSLFIISRNFLDATSPA